MIDGWVRERLAGARAVNLAVLHGWLCEEHGYAGSLLSMERYVSAHYPKQQVRNLVG